MEMTGNAARQWVEGNDGAFTDLFRSNRSEVLWAACRILGDRAAAENVVQETFLRLHRMRSRVDPTRPLRPLLLKIASNRAVDMLRRRRPEEDWEERIHSGREAEPVQTAIGDGRSHEAIAEELRNLPSQYRVVLVTVTTCRTGSRPRPSASPLAPSPSASGERRSYFENGWWRPKMNCHDVRVELAREERMPDPQEGAGVLKHLAACQSCRHFRATLQDEDRILRSVLSFSELDAARILELERRTLAILEPEPDGSAGSGRLLLPAAAALGVVVLVSFTGIETEPLRAQLQDALLQAGSPHGASIVMVTSLLSAMLGIAAGLLCRGREPLEGGST